MTSLEVRGVIVNAHIFPDSSSTVITQIEVFPENVSEYSRVLDPVLQEPWYWVTYEGDLSGYVSNRELDDQGRIIEGTLIRVNPTYNSWVLTRYEPGDDARVRSRLSIARVSIRKEIPVYFKLPVDGQTELRFKPVEDTPQPPAASDATPPYLSNVTVQEPTPEHEVEPEPVAEEYTLPEDPGVDAPKIIADLEETSEEVEGVPVEVPTIRAEDLDEVDPLLEEMPRIPEQKLAALSPPLIALTQDFTGYFHMNREAATQELYPYELQTKSGKRIAYLDISKLVQERFDSLLKERVSIKGTLNETEDGDALYIGATTMRLFTDSE